MYINRFQNLRKKKCFDPIGKNIQFMINGKITLKKSEKYNLIPQTLPDGKEKGDMMRGRRGQTAKGLGPGNWMDPAEWGRRPFKLPELGSSRQVV